MHICATGKSCVLKEVHASTWCWKSRRQLNWSFSSARGSSGRHLIQKDISQNHIRNKDVCVCTYECKPRSSGCSVIPCCKYRCAWCPLLYGPRGILLFILPLNFYRWGRFCCYKIFWSGALLNGKSAFTTAGRVYYKLCFLLLLFFYML